MKRRITQAQLDKLFIEKATALYKQMIVSSTEIYKRLGEGVPEPPGIHVLQMVQERLALELDAVIGDPPKKLVKGSKNDKRKKLKSEVKLEDLHADYH